MLILLKNEELNYLYSSFNYCEYLFHSIRLSLYALKRYHVLTMEIYYTVLSSKVNLHNYIYVSLFH